MIDNNSSLTGLQQNQFRYSISQQCKKTCKQPKSKLMSNHDEMFYLNEEEFVFKNDDNDDEILNNKQSIDSTSLIKSKSKEKLKEISRSNYMHNEIDFTLNDQLQKQNKSKRKISIKSVDELASNKTRLKSLKLDFYNKNHSSSSINDDLNSSISPQTFESLNNFSSIPVNSNENKEDFDNYFKGKTDILKITCSFVDSNNNLQNSKNTEFNLDQTNNKRILTNSENYRVNTGMTTISDLLIIKANYNLLKFTGLKEDEITGKSFKILLKECDLEKYEELLQKILNKIMHVDPALSYYMKPFRLLIVHNWKDENFEKRKLNASAINYEDMNIWPVISLGNNSDSNFLIELYLQRYEDSRLEIISDQKISKDCGIDRIMTLIDLHGTIISLDASNYREKSGSIKRPFPIVNIKKNHGLISDYLRLESSNQNENRYMLKLTDYVHNNDLVHIQKHVNDVLTKGEITSAIYRLKINEKYAFVQSQSKLIKNEKFEEQGSSEISNEFNQTYIHTIHSIIKEIDTEMEMKGNASTSLMKTLISKKSSSTNNLNLANDLANLLAEDSTKIQIKQSSTKDDFSGDISVDVFDPPQLQANIDLNFVNFNESVSPNSQLSAICKNLNIKSNVTPNGIANGESSLLTPIGTKFALTMLGLSKTQNKINLKKNSNSFENLNCSSSSNQNIVSLVSDNQLKEYSVNQSKVSKEMKRENDFFPSGNINNDFDCMDIKTIKENKLKLNLIKKKSIEENAFNLKNSIDPDSSFKMLIKKELQSLEERQINENNENNLERANLIQIKSNRPNSKNIPTFSCFENSGQHENFQDSTNKKKSSASENLTPKLRTKSGSKNILLKQLLSEESMIPTELAYSELGSEINSNIKTEEEKSKVNKQSTSNNYSSFNSKEENEINLKSSNDDILLRALLNTNDLEADTLKIESVFKLGKTLNSNHNSRNCKINRQTSENKNKIKKEIFENDRYMDNLNDDAFEKFDKSSNSVLSDSYSKTHGSIHFANENEEILSKNIKSEVDDFSLKKQIRNQPLNNLINSYERISVEKNVLSLDQNGNFKVLFQFLPIYLVNAYFSLLFVL
ncbi:unnamed protein product [Brachionus calyciflorus]|uniref:PAS domain-containing protein n=1 Tax=Brachionus calyciflorus TaxID=104777 RepID=A0A813PV80_9BILA|nr:unnamed protein product [Brachionus calyciflorus]